MLAFLQKHVAVLNHPKLEQELRKIKEEKSLQKWVEVFVALSLKKSLKAGI